MATDRTTRSDLVDRQALTVERLWPTAAAAGGLFVIAALLALFGAAGCAEHGNLLPDADPYYRRSMAQFAADAGPLHPYKADAPRGGKANGRAQVNYLFDTLEIANFSQEHWDDVEIWVNGAYVVHVPRIQGNAEETRRLSFWMLCDATGKAFPRGNTDPQNHIRKVEMLRNGTMYDIHLQLAD